MNIEKIVVEKQISYLEAIIHYCETNKIEVETAAKLINTKIKKTLEYEASELNLLKEKNNKLPI
jgi:hypothetical protein